MITYINLNSIKREKGGNIMQKRGQVTFFIIIGILLLASAALFFYFRTNVMKEAEIIDPEFLPVQRFTEDCLNQVAEEAITIVGLNGGYINFPEKIENNPSSYLQSGPIKDFKIPYWWYSGRNSIPTEEFIGGQIAAYIGENIGECLNDYQDFEDDFIIKMRDNPKAAIEMGDRETIVRLSLPITITNKMNDTTTKISKFSAAIPIRLKAAYELARTIMEKENEEAFIEEKAIDLMSMDLKIPTTDVAMGCSKKVWFLPEVQQRIKQLLRANLPYLKIKGTVYNQQQYVSNPFSEKDTYQESYFNYHYVWNLGDEKYNGLHASFNYDESYPLSLYARPSKGQKLESNTQKSTSKFSLICLQIWHFTYDLDFPVKVTIKDEETKEHKEYLFNFAFKASINHNQPNRKNYITTVFRTDDSISEDEFCQDTKNLINIYTEDDANSYPVDDVNLTFTCGIYTCDIGATTYLGYGAAAGLTKKLPYCVYGILRGKTGGYEDAEMAIQTDTSRDYTMFMTPVKLINKYKVVKHSSANLAMVNEPAQDETAMITIELPEKKFESFAIYPAQGQPLKLLGGDNHEYELSIYLMKGDAIVGGYEGKWFVGWGELQNAGEITFHVIQSSGSETERYAFLGELKEHSLNIPQPELK